MLESETTRVRVRDHRTGALHHHLQKPRKGKSYTGSRVRHARQGTRLRSLTQNVRPLLVDKRHQLAACFSQQTRPALASHPSASVVDVEVQSLVAEQGVGVVKFEQVDALPRVVMAASLHVSVAVPPVHRHDLPIATP